MIDSHSSNVLCAFRILPGLFLNLWWSEYNSDVINFMVPDFRLAGASTKVFHLLARPVL